MIDDEDLTPEEDNSIENTEADVEEMEIPQEHVAPHDEHAKGETVTVQPVQFASFEDLDQVQGPQNQNLNPL